MVEENIKEAKNIEQIPPICNLTLEDKQVMLQIIANTQFKGADIEIIYRLIQKLQK